jgi:hypothetical protein
MALSREQVKQMVIDEAVKQGVDPTLATRLAWQESRFNPDARSKAGAIGTMQLMPGTAKDLGVDPGDVAANIRGGITYLKQQLERFKGDQRLALAAYNAGPGAVQKYGDVPPYKETQHYVATILGGQGPPTVQTARNTPAGRDWGQELGFTAQAQPQTDTGEEPAPERPASLTDTTLGDWTQVLEAQAAPGGEQGQDWAALLFG